MLNYKFDNEQGKIILEAEGAVGTEDILEFYTDIEKNDTYPRELKILASGESVKFSFKPTELRKIKKASNRAAKKYDQMKEAFVIRTSYAAALGYFYQSFRAGKKNRIKIFSTKEAAINWLDLN